ncbi:MAG: hypothetical protein OSB42_10665 [Planctomycetota bacterium]|nr:hypothetical protein [Planctomycetota bacterium]
MTHQTTSRLLFVSFLLLAPTLAMVALECTGMGGGNATSGYGGGSADPPPIDWGGPGDGPAAPGAPGPRPGAPATGPAVTPGPAGPANPAAAPAAPITPGALGLDSDEWMTFWSLHKDLFARPAVQEQISLTPSTGQAPGQINALDRRDEVAKTMIDLLGTANIGPEVTHEALIALGRCGKVAPDAGGVLIASKFLSNAKSQISQAAVTSIAAQGTSKSLLLLRDLLLETRKGKALVGSTSVPLRLRTFAAYGIGIACTNDMPQAMRTFGAQTLVEVLHTRAQRSNDLACACVLALSVIPLPDMPPSEDPEGQLELANLAPSSSNVALLGFLEKRMGDEGLHRSARGYCATALARIANRQPRLRERSMDAILKLTGMHAEVPNEVERCAVLALGELSTAGGGRLDTEARKHLEWHTQHGDLVARHYACLALGRSLRRPDETDDGFHGMHGTISGMLRAFDKAKGRDLPFHAIALGMAGHGMTQHQQAVPERMRMALEKPLRRFRQPMRAATIALGLGLLHDPRSGSRIEEGLKSIKDPHSQAHFVLALGMSGDTSRLPTIAKLGSGAEHLPDLLESTGRARALLKDPQVSKDLGVIHASCDCPMTTAGSCAALASTRDRNNFDTLLAAATDRSRSKSARATAIRQLGRLVDRRPLSWELTLGQFTSLFDAPTTLISPKTWTGILDTRTP